MQNKRGQVTILALLLSLLGLTVSLSVASRSLSDLRQVAVVDQGTKALAAAEAGVQFGLNQLTANPAAAMASCLTPAAANLSLSGIKPYTGSTDTSGTSYSVCSNTASYVFYPSLAQDDVVQVNIGSMQANNVKSFYVLWKNPNAALEMMKLGNNGNVTRWSYNGIGLSTVANSFAPGLPVAGSNVISATCGDSTFNSGSWTGYDVIPVSKNADLYFRVKSIYSSTDVAICAYTNGSSPGRLDLQYYQVTAIATSSGGVTKKIQTTQIFNYLPSVFDSVFYSGGNLAK